ncbi:hypothetical protein [Polyangium fumosum]|uniref:hypothetical protein n=1 Tax=Polyangium fumosum TaxID=889272 RepID=UPI0014795A70|nr:hypothetical protein [Polyangium fumosum]
MMVKRQLALVLVSTMALLGVACGGGEIPQADTPPPPPPAETTPPPAETTPPPAPTAAAPAPEAAPAPAPEPAPAPKPGKERIVGQWQFDLSGEPRAAAEAEAKKKAGKDEKKYAALIKETEDAAAGEWIEFTADSMYVSHITEKGKDKVILKVKYEVAKDENGAIVMKPSGKDEISKKEMPKDLEIAVTFKDDKTIELKDPKKKMTLVFKRKS